MHLIWIACISLWDVYTANHWRSFLLNNNYYHNYNKSSCSNGSNDYASDLTTIQTILNRLVVHNVNLRSSACNLVNLFLFKDNAFGKWIVTISNAVERKVSTNCEVFCSGYLNFALWVCHSIINRFAINLDIKQKVRALSSLLQVTHKIANVEQHGFGFWYILWYNICRFEWVDCNNTCCFINSKSDCDVFKHNLNSFSKWQIEVSPLEYWITTKTSHIHKVW